MSILEMAMQLPKLEKLRLMESLWDDLNQTGAGVDSPAWHAPVLRETEARLANGQERMLEWEDAKQRLLGRQS